VSTAQPHQPRLDDLIEAERDIVERLGDLPVDFDALALVSNLYRAAAVIRREMEQTVLAPARLSWTAFVTLWVLWIWGEMETRHLAAEANVTKGTLTGVVDTLERRGLVVRRRGEDDRRLVTVELTGQGRDLITEVFPRFNAQEARVAGMVSPRQRKAMTSGLRQIIRELGNDV
jgi:MarR family transcriptional regulator, organic hydroperoxide resistance regulator